MKQFIYIGSIGVLLTIVAMTVVANPVISMDDIQIVEIGNSASINIILNSAPDGLSGYNITITVHNSSIADITTVDFPSWAVLNNKSSLPATSLWIKAVDLNKQVEPGAININLATITLKSKNFGNSFINISVNRLDDDDGFPIYAIFQNGTLDVVQNKPPNKPNNPFPINGSSNNDITVDLSWSGGDPNLTDDVTYTVYFGKNNPPIINVTDNQTGTTYNPGRLEYDTTYYWQIVAWDTHGASNKSEIWNFKTKKQPVTGGGGFIPPADTTQPPLAMATVDKNTGTPGEIFTFDAGDSTASDDREIMEYLWDFDDGTIISTNETMITHFFDSISVYHVMLTVEDDNGETGSLDEPLIIEIVQANNPPEIIEVIPETTWTHKQTNVTFTMSAFDPDVNDTIRFEIEWGDGEEVISDHIYESNETFTISHQWDSFGVYHVTVTVFDEHNASSAPVATVMLVDVVALDEINGWLIDRDSDGVFDVFKDLVTAVETAVEEQADGSYLIDSSNDGIWDYTYCETDGLQEYKEEVPDETPGFPLFLMLFGLVVCIIVWKKQKRKNR